MTELERGELIREWFTLMQGQGALVNGDTTVLFTLLFGYLVVAYFVGKDLSRTQSIIFTVLYMVAFVTSLFNMASNAMASVAFTYPLLDVCPECELPPLVSPEGTVLICLVNLAMLTASLYFMWSVRHPKAE